MIQGPPGIYVLHRHKLQNYIFSLGTGKSVTGAHIAYALAMRFSKEQTEGKENTCVMYCGPSQQSVNVVLGKFLSK